MTLTIHSDVPREEKVLPNGSKLLLLDVLGKAARYSKEEQNRNLFLLDPKGEIIWRVAYHEGIRGHDPFVETQFSEDGKVIGFTWDGWRFAVNVDDGNLVKLGWSK